MKNTFEFKPKEVVDMIEKSFKCAFLPDALKNNLAEVARLEAENLFRQNSFPL